MENKNKRKEEILEDEENYSDVRLNYISDNNFSLSEAVRLNGVLLVKLHKKLDKLEWEIFGR